MYYSNNKIFIIDNTLFNLNNFEIYKVNDDIINIFEHLYNGNISDDLIHSENYSLVKEMFFNSLDDDKNSKNYKIDNNDVKNLQIKISNTCNLVCKYCYANHGNYGNENRIMSQEIAYKIALKINDEFPNIEKISFFGGEPLLNIDAMEIIMNTLSNKDIKYSMVSNVTIFNEKLENLLEKFNLSIIASLDGPKEINDLNRIFPSSLGTYNIIESNIKRIQNHSNSIKMIESVYTLPSYKKYSKQELYEYFYNEFKLPLIGIGNVFTDNENLKLPQEYLDNMSMDINNELDYTFEKINKQQFFVINNLYDIISVFLRKKGSNYFCGAGLGSLFIDELGDIYPCQLFVNDKNHNMGNFLNDKYFKILNTVRDNIITNSKKISIDECKNCVSNFWCFKCIGKHKDEKNYGACRDIKQCDYYRELTELTLKKFAQMINDNTFNNFISNCKVLQEKASSF